MHLTSLPGEYGIGELGASAYRFVDALKSMGIGVWQFLPTGPTAYADSPYQSSSMYAGNPLLIDLAALRDEALLSDTELEPFCALPRDTVDFGDLVPLKIQLLARVGERFGDAASPSKRLARDEFVATHDAVWLHDYALFEVLKTLHQQRAWSEWDEAYGKRDAHALEAIEAVARIHIESIKSIQFLFYQQWQRLKDYAGQNGIRLMGDVPIYVALDSAEAWARPDLLYLDEDGLPIDIAGVPPDYFSADGQRWGNPLYRWERHAADGYRWWIARLRHATTMVDLVRLDHFRGLESYWAVPAQSDTARDGEWRPGPAERLLDALVESFGELPLVAEDLGIITPQVEALRDRYGLPGMKVLQFMVGEEDFHRDLIPENCVCYTGTHDNDTSAGWFHEGLANQDEPSDAGRVRDTVLRHTAGKPETIHQDLIRLAFASDAALAIAPMQDFLGLGSEARMNIPGTTEGNWRWRLRSRQTTPQLCEWVRRAVSDSGRS